MHKSKLALILGVSAAALSGCASAPRAGQALPPATFVGSDDATGEKYIIGPLDSLNIFVWRNSELGGKVQVRPDGMITTPLISDLQAAGKTPAELAEDIRMSLTQYVEDPRVSVMVDSFQGTFGQQIRIVGATAKPASLPYRANMTLLDAMIEVGGLSEYAAGDRARLIRHDRASGAQKEYDLKIARLLKKGDTRANVRLEPGDVIIIPESMF
ncbi:polysaccharide export protein [Sphingomonas parva]|uniref:Polysaccharide export protein n=1 Tax=Sphingomonas parva TaxID=2555898 RepID=A0A4Y8ZUP8_9SPHN|nr:XrtA/PEP-CTERM system exopolysaccharide export protein [Sphingomonas parva]TFI58186.1 polysaccharide export protein [Sphingomonas parva]